MKLCIFALLFTAAVLPAQNGPPAQRRRQNSTPDRHRAGQAPVA